MSRQAWSHSAQAQAVVTDEQTGETRVGTVTAEIKGELSEAVPAPAAWAGIPSAGTHVPGMTFLVAVIPDEDPDLKPTVHIHSHDEHVIPYEITRWFMEHVAEHVERCRIVTGVGQAVT